MWGAVVALLLSLVAYVTGFIMVYSQDSPNYIAAEFRDLPASFGGGLPLEGMRGQLTAGEPRDGCSPLAPPPPGQNDIKWIVLIARYNCSFEVKVRNAQAAGYDCAIVHNVNASDLETMSAKNAEDIVIPSVFVSDVSGEKLAAFYLYDNDPSYYLVVNGDVPFDINTNLLLPFAIVVAICLLVMLVFMIVKCMNERARARRHRLPNRALRKIPTCKFSKGDPYETCAICLDDYLEGERLRVLPCAHAYHAKCIDPWLTQNRRVCPVCKRRVLAAGERRPQSDSDSDGSDHRPLVSHEHRPPPTQGGTFEQQRENPFVRAARFMARLRSRNDQNDSQEAPIEEPADVAVTNEDNVEDDTQPLLQASVTSQSERPRRSRRHGRSRRFAPGAQSPLRPAEHSINRGGRGEIGVAALPATPETHPPTHVSL